MLIEPMPAKNSIYFEISCRGPKFLEPKLPKIITNGPQGSWWSAHREAKRWHKLILNHIVLNRLKPIEPFKKVKLTLVRYSSVRPDFDNLHASFKYVVDGLVRAGVLIDDCDAVIVERSVRHEKVKALNGRITIEVECLE